MTTPAQGRTLVQLAVSAATVHVAAVGQWLAAGLVLDPLCAAEK
ncbi:hypothetical protein [Streptomyces neyagawaensis]|uniref:Uncharacterized protein n=1 Tax=Streptomyces neyagawaensis TaxID=42238 RepID=A0ABV3B2X2_9ACTN